MGMGEGRIYLVEGRLVAIPARSRFRCRGVQSRGCGDSASDLIRTILLQACDSRMLHAPELDIYAIFCGQDGTMGLSQGICVCGLYVHRRVSVPRLPSAYNDFDSSIGLCHSMYLWFLNPNVLQTENIRQQHFSPSHTI